MRNAWRGRDVVAAVRRAIAIASVGCPVVVCSVVGALQAAPDDASSFATPSAVAALVQALNEESAAFSERETSEIGGDAGPRAQRRIRLLAAGLLASGDRAGEAGQDAVLAGLTLAQVRVQLDPWLAAAASDAGLRASIGRFNDDATALLESPRHFDAEQVDAILPATFRHLVEAIEHQAGRPLQTRWVAIRRAGDAVAPSGAAHSSIRIDELRAQIESAPVSDQTKQELATILDFLSRGSQFPEIRREVHKCAADLHALLHAARTIDAADWMGDPLQKSLLNLVHEAAAMLKDPRLRPRSEPILRRLAALAAVLDRIQQLAKLGDEAALVVPILTTLHPEHIHAESSGELDRGLDRLAEIVEVIVRYRMLQKRSLPSRLMQIERHLLKTYQSAERALLENLQIICSSDRWRADPALSSFVSNHRDSLDDLARLHQAQDWINAIGEIDPRSREPFESLIVDAARDLTEMSKRIDAQKRMDAFGEQIRRYQQLPFEEELAGASNEVIALSGGLHREMLDRIETQRRAWAQAWSHNRPEEAAQAMEPYYRLMRSVHDVAAIADESPSVSLNRWSAWEMPPEALSRPRSAAINRVKLAIADAVNVEDGQTALADQIARIEAEASLVLLAGRLHDRLGEHLLDASSAVEDAIAQLAFAPVPGDIGEDHRRRLAQLSRLAFESAHARAIGASQNADAIEQRLNQLANQLLEDLGPSPSRSRDTHVDQEREGR